MSESATRLRDLANDLKSGAFDPVRPAALGSELEKIANYLEWLEDTLNERAPNPKLPLPAMLWELRTTAGEAPPFNEPKDWFFIGTSHDGKFLWTRRRK